jgi:hypothetical protein
VVAGGAHLVTVRHFRRRPKVLFCRVFLHGCTHRPRAGSDLGAVPADAWLRAAAPPYASEQVTRGIAVAFNAYALKHAYRALDYSLP